MIVQFHIDFHCAAVYQLYQTSGIASTAVKRYDPADVHFGPFRQLLDINDHGK